MQDVVVGLLAIGVGGLFCFRGYVAMRVLIPVWGAFAGFFLGAGLIAAASDDGFLRSALAWIVGLAVGLLFGLLAYLYYEVSVLIAMAAVGFVLGTSAMVVLGVSWSWLIVLAGVAVGALLAVIAIAGDLPTVILIVLTAFGGANTVVFGLTLVIGAVDTSEFETPTTTERLDDSVWWYAISIALAVAGIVAQARYTERLRTSVRSAWVDSGGREFRSG